MSSPMNRLRISLTKSKKAYFYPDFSFTSKKPTTALLFIKPKISFQFYLRNNTKVPTLLKDYHCSSFLSMTQNPFLNRLNIYKTTMNCIQSTKTIFSRVFRR
jgi:hypothetical protein